MTSVRSIFVAGLIGVAAGAALAQDFDAVEIRSQRVGPGVFLLEGAGGNIGVSIGPDGTFLIDDQFAPLTAKIRAALAALGADAVRFVINTHWHPDHTGGNENLGRAGALIVAHDNVRRRMSAGQFLQALDRQIEPAPASALPLVTFTETVTFHLNGDEIHAFHVESAHTDGDTMIHFRKANVLHMGDVYFRGAYPFIDVESGGSVDGTIAAVERALALVDDGTKIIPGHGALSDKKELRGYLEMLRAARAAIAPLVRAGRSVGEIVAAEPTAALDDPWGKGYVDPERFVKSVVESLAAKTAHDNP